MNYWRSSCSWRVRMALYAKGLFSKTKYVAINLLTGDDTKPEYFAINPSGVPTFIDSDPASQPITQSLAIMEYLEERYPGGEFPLLPRDFTSRAIVRSISNYIASAIQPLQNLGAQQRVDKLAGPDAKKAWTSGVIAEGMDGLELLLKKYAGKFCFGDTLTMADMCLVPQAYACRRFGVELSNYPTVFRVLQTVEAMEIAVATHPDQMPDAIKQ